MGALKPGDRLGSYVVASGLGEGGQAEIYAAIRRGPGGFEKRVALKVLKLPSQGISLENLFREARNAALLDHRNIVQVHEVAEADGLHFLVMDYVDGVTLAALYAAHDGVLPPWLVVGVGLEVAQALVHAHEFRHPEHCPRGMIHRDVKPSNILVSCRGDVRLADFGLAKRIAQPCDELTRVGVVRGTPNYMSPEQLRGSNVTRATDVYSLGVTLYRVIAGRAVARWNPSTPPPRLSQLAREVPESLAGLVAAAMDPVAERRPNARRLTRELEQELGRLASRAHLSVLRDELARRVGRAQQQAGQHPPEEQTQSHRSAGQDPFAPHVAPDRPAAAVRPPASEGPPSGAGRAALGAPDKHAAWTGPTADDLIERAPPPTLEFAADALPRSRWRGVVALLGIAALLGLGLAIGMEVVGSPDPPRALLVADAAGAAPAATRVLAAQAVTAAGPAATDGSAPAATDGSAPAAAEASAPAATDGSAPAAAEASAPAATDGSAPAAADAARARADSQSDAGVARVTLRRPPRRRSAKWAGRESKVRSAGRASPKTTPASKRSGLLTINAEPWAWIYVDGERLGMTPIYRRPCAAGPHTIRIVGKNGLVRTRRVVVAPGEHANLGLIELSR